MTKFIIATNNPHKLQEMSRILVPLGIEAISAKEAGFDLDEVEETGTTFMENSVIKAEAVFSKTGMPAIADDSGLTVDALNGEPGVYSARYACEHGNSEANIEKLLLKLKDVPLEKRSAQFVTSICCILKNGEKIFANGTCSGTIGFEKRGESGFGYDPVFIAESGKSFAELSDSEKDEISHRGNALRELSKKLSEIIVN
ncbi:MAG: RdgB/HAM1 family non-canonical purine NTP pyrophosphatase [Bacillota bacterium]|nr:RdgB/HAM1 family non-canonical purine NTP pyrophosphatase [Bacillota bacterium]